MRLASYLARSSARAFGMAVTASRGKYRSWPPTELLIDDPLAMAEEKTNRLRAIYAKATRDVWDGPAEFRAAMERHCGIQLSREKREALAYPISMLMWGELAAWIVSAELAERLEDPDARLAASSQVFDEARHFYVMRDYLAALHVPTPRLDRYFSLAVRSLLHADDLNVKLLAMQLLAEGTAQSIFKFFTEAEIEPVLTDLLPLMERDEARHVGLGIMHLPDRLAKLNAKERRRIAFKVATIGDLFGATQIRYIEHYYTLGLDPRDLFRRCDKMLYGLSEKLGKVPGSNEPYFYTNNPNDPNYEKQLNIVLPPPGEKRHPLTKLIFGVVDAAWYALPA